MYENISDFGKEIAANGEIIETYAGCKYKGDKKDIDGRTDADAKYVSRM
ncbi:hypothetical protein F200043G1_22070 [[Clostridium] innocuum]